MQSPAMRTRKAYLDAGLCGSCGGQRISAVYCRRCLKSHNRATRATKMRKRNERICELSAIWTQTRIAAHFRLTEESIRRIWREHGVSPQIGGRPPISTSTKCKAVHMRKLGWKYREISEILNISHGAISRAIESGGKRK